MQQRTWSVIENVLICFIALSASSQLLKELDVLEMQFQIERSCRETAEALALKV